MSPSVVMRAEASRLLYLLYGVPVDASGDPCGTCVPKPKDATPCRIRSSTARKAINCSNANTLHAVDDGGGGRGGMRYAGGAGSRPETSRRTVGGGKSQELD